MTKLSWVVMIAALCAGAVRAAEVRVDCSGTSPAPVVADLAVLNAMHFEPGTRIVFKRGVTCHGSFVPKSGSGEPGKPIAIKFDGQVNPPLVGANAGDIAVFDGDRKLAAIPVKMRVLP